MTVTGRRRLRFSRISTSAYCSEPTHVTLGDRLFAAAGPQVGLWNSRLITQLRDSDIPLGQFRRASVYLLTVAAPSDSAFSCAGYVQIGLLAYLLTYINVQ